LVYLQAGHQPWADASDLIIFNTDRQLLRPWLKRPSGRGSARHGPMRSRLRAWSRRHQRCWPRNTSCRTT